MSQHLCGVEGQEARFPALCHVPQTCSSLVSGESPVCASWDYRHKHHICLRVGTGPQDLALPLVQPLLYLLLVHFFFAPFQPQPFTHKTKVTLKLWLSLTSAQCGPCVDIPITECQRQNQGLHELQGLWGMLPWGLWWP